jgi:hypothetical protein
MLLAGRTNEEVCREYKNISGIRFKEGAEHNHWDNRRVGRDDGMGGFDYRDGA